MANSVTRDIILKVKVVGDKSGADQAVKDQDRIGKAQAKAARDAERARAKAERDQARAATAEQKAAQRVAVNRIKLIGQIQKAEEKRAQEAIRQEERIKVAAQRAHMQRLQNNRQQLAAGRQIGQGILDMAQGLATLGVLSEKNTEHLLRMVVALSEGFRVMRGMADVATGLAQQTRIAAQASASLAATQGAGAATAAGAGTAGAAGGGALRNAATGGGLTAVMLGGAKAVGVALAKLTAIVGAAAIVHDAAARTVNTLFGTKLPLAFESLFGYFRDTANAAESAERLNKAMEHSARLHAAAAERDQRITAMAGIAAEGRSQQQSIEARLSAATGMAGTEDEARTERARAAHQLEMAEAEVEAERQRHADRQARRELQSIADQVQAVDQLREARERVATADERIVQALQRQVEQRKQAVGQAQQELDRARDLVKSEEARTQSALARFGQLDRASQNRLQEIAQQVQGGGALNRNQAEFLQQSGFGGRQAEEFFAQQGREAGGAGVLGGLGELDGLTQARRDEANAAARLAEAQAAAQAATEANTAAILKMAESMQSLADAQNAALQLQARQAGATQEEVGRTGFDVSGAIRAMNQEIVAETQRQRAQNQQVFAAQVNQP